MVASGASETPGNWCVATAPLFNWYETLKPVIGENPTFFIVATGVTGFSHSVVAGGFTES